MRWGLFVVTMGLLVPQAASAETLEVDRFEPARIIELLGLQGIDIDTGWQPPGSDIQVSFLLHADDDIVADLPGDAIYDWDTQELYFEGDEDEGYFGVEMGVVLDGRFRFDLLGIQFESSVIGPYDLGVFDDTTFTPYLLPGNDSAPAHIDTETLPIEVFNYAFVDAIIASGSFFVDANFDVDMRLSCDRIEVLADGSLVAGEITAEHAAMVIAPEIEGDDLDVTATLHCTLLSDVELVLYPGVQVSLLGQDFQLVPFELRIPLLDDREDPMSFEPLPLHFDAPPPPMPSGDSSSGGDESGGVSGGESGDEGSAGDSAGDGGETGGDDSSGGQATTAMSGTDSAGMDGGDSADGCGCRSDGTPPRGSLLLFALGVLGLRRRRQTPRN